MSCPQFAAFCGNEKSIPGGRKPRYGLNPIREGGSEGNLDIALALVKPATPIMLIGEKADFMASMLNWLKRDKNWFRCRRPMWTCPICWVEKCELLLVAWDIFSNCSMEGRISPWFSRSTISKIPRGWFWNSWARTSMGSLFLTPRFCSFKGSSLHPKQPQNPSPETCFR